MEKVTRRHQLTSILLLTSLFSFAWAGPEVFEMVAEKKNENVNIVTKDTFHLSENCLQDLKKCQAYLATQKKSEMIANKTNLAGHPASRYCISNKGKNIFLKNQKRQEYDYCLFSDNTLIDSWDLYYHFFPIEKVK